MHQYQRLAANREGMEGMEGINPTLRMRRPLGLPPHPLYTRAHAAGCNYPLHPLHRLHFPRNLLIGNGTPLTPVWQLSPPDGRLSPPSPPDFAVPGCGIHMASTGGASVKPPLPWRIDLDALGLSRAQACPIPEESSRLVTDNGRCHWPTITLVPRHSAKPRIVMLNDRSNRVLRSHGHHRASVVRRRDHRLSWSPAPGPRCPSGRRPIPCGTGRPASDRRSRRTGPFRGR